MKNKNEIMRRSVEKSLLPFIALASAGCLKVMFPPVVMVIACVFAVVTIWLQVLSSLQIKGQRVYDNDPVLFLRRK